GIRDKLVTGVQTCALPIFTDSNNFQDARAFLTGVVTDGEAVTGQRGRQRAILREGVYAINPVLFVVMTDGCVYRLGQASRQELRSEERRVGKEGREEWLVE